MAKKILGIMVALVMLLTAFGLMGCEQASPKDKVISYVNKLNEAKELKFIVEPNFEHSDDIQTAVQKYDNSGQLIYMHDKAEHRETGEVIGERLYQNGKHFDLIKKTYYEIVFTQAPRLSAGIPDVGLLGLESTTFEKISNEEYFVTIYPNSILGGDMFGDRVFEYTIKIKDNYISETHFAGIKTTVSRDIGQLITIDESEFSRSV